MSAFDATPNQTNATAADEPKKHVVDYVVWLGVTGKPSEYRAVRLKFANAPASDVLSQNQPPFIAEFCRGEGEAKIPVGSIVISSFKLTFPWAVSRRYAPADVMRHCSSLAEPILDAVKKLTCGKSVIHEVLIGHGEQTLANVTEAFLFAYLPAELATFQNEQDRLKGLSEWVLDFLEIEKQQELEKLKAEGNAKAVEQLKISPRHLPHEQPGIDHYENQKQVLDNLLRKEWPRFFAANDRLKSVKNDAEKVERQKQSWLAYIADYKSLFGHYPEVRPDEAAGLWRDENYLRLMAHVLDSKKGNVDKRDWRLASGWITSNYYRMNERELETAFNGHDWGGSHQKGSVLRKRAERIGLITALPRGRPEIHKLQDSVS